MDSVRTLAPGDQLCDTNELCVSLSVGIFHCKLRPSGEGGPRLTHKFEGDHGQG